VLRQQHLLLLLLPLPVAELADVVLQGAQASLRKALQTVQE
jgi:hypothetical protein